MKYMTKIDAKVDQIMRTQQATLERQVRQLAKAVSEREKGKLPRTSEVNPKFRSGKVLHEPKVKAKPKHDKGKDIVVDEAPKEVEKGEKGEESNPNKKEEVKPYVPPIPFPQRLKDCSK